MTRKDYIMLARVIKDSTIIDNSKMLPHNKLNKITLISDLMIALNKDNPLFNGKRFIDACAIDE
tara:strand:+ start:267 stop:458 length:192 start_codon:yes stop_codon:yes gene_type:complete